MLTLERSTDGKEFEKIEEHIISDFSFEQKKHIYTDDKNPHSGTSYYRIKLANPKKETTYISEVKKVEIETKEIENLIYPNPTKDSFYISSIYNAKNNLIQTVTIITLSGQTISRDYTVLSNQTISVKIPSTLSKGIYIVKCSALTKTYFAKLSVL